MANVTLGKEDDDNIGTQIYKKLLTGIALQGAIVIGAGIILYKLIRK